MTRPRIVVAPHARDLDTVLGRLHASIVYDQYCEKIVAAGGQPLVAWPGSPDVDDLAAAADAIVLIGGGDVAPGRFGMAAEASAVDHVRDEFETRLVLTAKEHATPVLGVCRGAQILNVALGGTLREVEGHRQAGDLTRPFHSVSVVGETRLSEIVGASELEVNSFHVWAPAALGRGLRPSGTAADVTEGIEYDGEWWALGVQWHVELLDDPAGQHLFDALVAAATSAS